MRKQIPIHLSGDEIGAIRRAFTAQIAALQKGLKEVTAPSVKEIVEAELVIIKKADLYLSEVIEAERNTT